ncbi:MAG: 4-hydroxyphenylpyruvate dioxygenase [Gammaproteobacteria bacterium RIFCSPHIGHO2_12_FULL_37_34]|nr:MAG: 4-hydroxyphenylpyruvate dioxygenase [Gammaproteobacteria bacterium RIFCSPHIGHO2_12_FULL_37_34]
MTTANPVGTNGFDFLEFTTHDRNKLDSQFKTMGMTPIAKHAAHDVTIYQQNDIRFIVNVTNDSMASQFADLHGTCACAMGFKVKDAESAFQYALAHGALPYQPTAQKNIYNIPAIYGVGNSLIYFVDYKEGKANYLAHFPQLSTHQPHPGLGLTYIDHVTHNLNRGQMNEWANFYTSIFNFREIRYFDIEGKLTGLKSRAMTSACSKIRIPLNESSDDKSQIEEFIKEFKGEGIQHIALGTNQIYKSVDALRKNGLEFLDTPDTYYELIEKRLPKHGEPLEELKKYRILVDGNTKQDKKILLQIFTKNIFGPVFFEIIQRKGDEGFGEGNFKALFESIELDQIRRGVLNEEETT